ncbi:LysE family translocator [Phaeovulum sp. W22_SRMD_FR3]|uniref:LysE family translocator n=1 Tax=Phaeovulum sp. W22_SRMD_FR3 TaxID=3240274 RepID=UPI003F963D94
MSFTLLTFALAALLTIALPGPTSLLAFSNGARHGLRDAGFGIAGAVLSDLVLIAAVSAGLGVLLSTSHLLFTVVKWLGVAYLAAVGLRLLLSKAAAAEAPMVQVTERRRLFSRSFLVAVTNPKGYLFFTALLPQFIDAAAPVLPQYLLLAVTFSLIDLAVLLAYAAAGRRCAGRFGATLLARMDRVCGGVFLVLAGGLAMLRRAAA